MIDKIRNIVENYSFGVCSFLAQKMGLKTGIVRLYFIYLSFIALGSPLIIYLVIAFWINIKSYLRRGRNLLLE